MEGRSCGAGGGGGGHTPPVLCLGLDVVAPAFMYPLLLSC